MEEAIVLVEFAPHDGRLRASRPRVEVGRLSAPGLGTSGTAGDYGAPLQIVRMQYTLAYTYDPAFVPITSIDQIAAAEAAGKLLAINAGAPDPYQLWTSTVLVRPIVGPIRKALPTSAAASPGRCCRVQHLSAFFHHLSSRKMSSGWFRWAKIRAKFFGLRRGHHTPFNQGS